MYCPNCGSENNDNEEVCKACNTSLKNVEIKTEENKVTENVGATNQNNENTDDLSFSPGYSIFLIIFSVLCCGGIIAAVFAILALIEGNKIKDYVAAGNLEMARKAKADSKKWTKATYITWAVVAVLMIVYFIFVFGVTFLSASATLY